MRIAGAQMLGFVRQHHLLLRCRERQQPSWHHDLRCVHTDHGRPDRLADEHRRVVQHSGFGTPHTVAEPAIAQQAHGGERQRGHGPGEEKQPVHQRRHLPHGHHERTDGRGRAVARRLCTIAQSRGYAHQQRLLLAGGSGRRHVAGHGDSAGSRGSHDATAPGHRQAHDQGHDHPRAPHETRRYELTYQPVHEPRGCRAECTDQQRANHPSAEGGREDRGVDRSTHRAVHDSSPSRSASSWRMRSSSSRPSFLSETSCANIRSVDP